jgi:hypothetical protein
VADILSWQWNKYYAETLAKDISPRTPRRDCEALFAEGPAKPRIFLYTSYELSFALQQLWNPDQPQSAEMQKHFKLKEFRKAHLS